jgi:hypothetical protein
LGVSSEKDYMECPTSAVTTATVSPLGQQRCVWTSHPSHDYCCRAGIPATVVLAAWGAELERGRAGGDRFFHFSWRGEVWLAYGLRNGCVRGVYCPMHSAARDGRSFAPEEAHPVALTA